MRLMGAAKNLNSSIRKKSSIQTLCHSIYKFASLPARMRLLVLLSIYVFFVILSIPIACCELIWASKCLDRGTQASVIDAFWNAHNSNARTKVIIGLTVAIWILGLVIIGLEMGVHIFIGKILSKRAGQR